MGILQARHTDGHKAHEEMFNITTVKELSQNYSKVSPNTGQNGQHQEIYKQMLERVWIERSPPTLLVGM